MIRIDKQLGRYFSLVTISSVILITLLANLGMNVFFTRYLRQSQQSEDAAIADYVTELYMDDGVLDETDLMSIEHYAFTMSSEVIVENEEGEVIMSTREPDGSGGSDLERSAYMDNEKFSYKVYEYGQNGEGKAEIVVGRAKSIFAASPDRDFFIAINLIYLLAGIIAMIFRYFLQNRVSGTFLGPIIAIQGNAKLIENGAFGAVKDVDSDTIELDELSRSITNMAMKLEEQERLRKRLTADIAHELRTPLSTVNSHLEAFIDGVWEPTTERLALLQDEIRRLTSLIKDLGDLSYMESGEIRLSKKEVNLSEFLTGLVENFEPLFLSEEISLSAEVEENVYALCDSDRMNQVFINIIANSLKYTNPGGYVRVMLKRKGNFAEVKVADNGIGITKEDIPYVFERFYRSDRSRSRETGGKGIGLTVSKALVEAHEGEISIESSPNEGTIVKIILPALTENTTDHT